MKQRFLRVHSPLGDLPPVPCPEGEWILGSGNGAGVVSLNYEGVAPRHARLRLGSNAICVEDLGSATGTLVNGIPVTVRVEVDYPAFIQIGAVTVIVGDAESPEALNFAADATLRIVREGRQGAPSMHPLAAPDVTGRIYEGAPFGALNNLATAQMPEEAVLLPESTLAFSMETEVVQTDGSVSSAVDYALKQEIAKGGMGRIFTAEDPKLERLVAVKLSSVKERSEDAQFFTEAKVLAQLAHPNIVPIHSIGTDSGGRPFYSMKLVNGRTLQAILKLLNAGDAETAGVYSRLRLLTVFRKVCDAVSFAHARGYLHRDLKPENVMVGEFGEVLVMDWGLAKKMSMHAGSGLLREGDGGDEEPEVLNYVEGTPQYMSPEQAEGVYRGLDERSDIYSLGGILHAILTGRPPVTGSSVNEVLDKVRKGETTTMTMPRGSFRMGGLSEMAQNVPEAIRAVTLKALSRKPEDRYRTVAELDADIEAYLNGFATSAEEASAFRKVVLFAKRHRAASVLAVVLLAGACVFTVRLAASERTATANALLAEREAKIASANAIRAQENAKLAEEQKSMAEANAQKAIVEKEAARHSAALAQIALADAAVQRDNAEEVFEALKVVPEDLRNQEWRYLNEVADSSLITIHAKGGSALLDCVPHPKKPGTLFTLQADRWFRTLDLGTGAAEDVLKVTGSYLTGAFAVSPDATKIAFVERFSAESGAQTVAFEVVIVTLASGDKKQSPRFTQSGRVKLQFSPGGGLLAKVSEAYQKEGGGLAIFDVETGKRLWERSGDGIYDAEFKPVSDGLFLASQNHGWLDLDGRTGLSKAPAKSLASIPRVVHSQTVFAPLRDTVACILPGATKPSFEFRLPKGLENPRNLAINRKNNLLLTLTGVADGAAVLQVRNANYGDLIQSIPVCINRSEGSLWKMVSHAESNDVAVFRGSTMKVWNLARLDQKRIPVSIGNYPASSGLAFLDSPQRILQVSAVEPQEGNVRGFNFDLFQIQGTTLEKKRTLSPLSLMADTAPKFTSSLNGRVSVFLLAQGGTQSLHTCQMNAEGECNVSTNPIPVTLGGFNYVSPEGDKVWGGNGFYAVPSGSRMQTTDRQDTPPSVFSISGGAVTCWTDNEHVVEVALVKNGSSFYGAQRRLVLWSAGQAASVVSVPAPRAVAVAASPDGLLLAEGGDDGRVRIRDAKTLEVQQILRVHDSPVTVLAWHPTLPRLATSSADLSVKIWNVQTELLEESLALLDRPLSQLHWSRDGRTLALSMYGLRCFVTPKSCQ